MLNKRIAQLINYAVKNGLITAEDRIWATNRLLEAMVEDEYSEPTEVEDCELEEILSSLCDIASEKGLLGGESVVYRDLFDTKLMGLLTPAPHEVISEFGRRYAVSPRNATDWFYDFSRSTDYIRTYRVKKDMKWMYPSEFGDIDITINLSKPEKDPKAIAAAKNAPQSGYPKCALCAENEGYAGNIRSAARNNHRIIPITLGGEKWYLQYSPYVYYNEHCIALSGEHRPMKINRALFDKMLDFVTIFPHYFIGSNADLPIVGGSILSHDHMQGGRYEFAMERAPITRALSFDGFENVEAGIVEWPLSVIRLRSDDMTAIADLAEKILEEWRRYTDEDAFIFAETEGVPHNTITPIARRRGEKFELDLVLRNNITTEEHPLGVYHPHADKHNIKKENIGLIEVMGLAVLPARLKNEMHLLKEAILSGADILADDRINKHAKWF
ncbi:MAG: UDP-glucose--hexose-1-phosphate uridylyltransferase, partial [Eubacterium sp.]|nr:UDP-glucose--hexose-1-phosphate uridylyltransferase [Eubacterium sp.]